MLHKFTLFIICLILLISCGPAVETRIPVLDTTRSPQTTTPPLTVPAGEPEFESEPLVVQTTPFLPPATLTAVSTAVPRGDPVFISADDVRIRYIGRFDFSDAQHPFFDWSGVSITAAFSGPSLSILLEDGNNFYNVTIDGRSKVLQANPDETTYLVAQDLPQGPHVVQLTKRTEAYVGAGIFSGFVLGAGHDLLEKPASSERHIEFYGDSITTGYGNEGDSPQCWFAADTQNIAQSFAAQTADHFNADYSIVALSGLGVARNLRSEEASSAETAIDFVDRTVAMNPDMTWEPQNEIPDVVVVNLGTNDFSSLPFPEVETFVIAYVDLLRQIRRKYPQAPLFVLAGPLMLDPAPDLIRTAVERMRLVGSDENVYFVAIEDTFDDSAADFGCDWHPNVQGHKKITDQLVPVMADVLGW